MSIINNLIYIQTEDLKNKKTMVDSEFFSIVEDERLSFICSG
jgi:hypothetical protein